MWGGGGGGGAEQCESQVYDKAVGMPTSGKRSNLDKGS